MTKSKDPQFPTLLDDVRTALKQWHGETNVQTPLRYLYLFRQISRERHLQNLSGERGAINQLLRVAIERLEYTHTTDAELLQYRFLDAWPIQRLANHYNVADSTVYTMQASAIERLTDTLRQLELDTSAAQKDLLLTRLEPPSYVNLIGIGGLVSQLKQVLTSDDSPWLVALEGIGGIGKTSLADCTLRQLIHQGIFDEVGWVTARQVRFNLGGAINELAEPALSAEMLVERLVAQLMPELAVTQLSTEELVRALRARLKATPHLIVIDNLETLVDVESLLPTLYTLVSPTRIILTSRESLRKEANIFHFQLTELSQADAIALLRQEARQSNLPLLAECPEEELIPIIDAVGGNPLALRLVVGQTHIHTLASIVQDLELARGESVENLYTFVYRRAWDTLEQTTREVFLAMPMAQLSGETIEYLTDICQIEVDQVRVALGKLVLLNLIEAHGGLHERRFTIHSLTRTFLQEQVAKW